MTIIKFDLKIFQLGLLQGIANLNGRIVCFDKHVPTTMAGRDSTTKHCPSDIVLRHVASLILIGQVPSLNRS